MSGVLFRTSQYAGRIGSGSLASYAALADTFPFEEECPPTGGGAFGLLVREPVGVVGAIIPWNAPVALICHKIGPALLAGCTVGEVGGCRPRRLDLGTAATTLARAECGLNGQVGSSLTRIIVTKARHPRGRG